MNLIQVVFDCFFNLDANVQDGYKYHDGLIQVEFDFCYNLDMNGKDGYKC